MFSRTATKRSPSMSCTGLSAKPNGAARRCIPRERPLDGRPSRSMRMRATSTRSKPGAIRLRAGRPAFRKSATAGQDLTLELEQGLDLVRQAKPPRDARRGQSDAIIAEAESPEAERADSLACAARPCVHERSRPPRQRFALWSRARRHRRPQSRGVLVLVRAVSALADARTRASTARSPT